MALTRTIKGNHGEFFFVGPACTALFVSATRKQRSSPKAAAFRVEFTQKLIEHPNLCLGGVAQELLADEGNRLFAGPHAESVVDLPGQQPQWQADHAGLVFQ